jgi:hypothetical protein
MVIAHPEMDRHLSERPIVMYEERTLRDGGEIDLFIFIEGEL